MSTINVSDAPSSVRRSQKAMKLIDPHTGEMECKFCGSHHYTNLKPQIDGGGYLRGSWQCRDQYCPSVFAKRS